MAEYHGAARAVGGCPIYVRYCVIGPRVSPNLQQMILRKHCKSVVISTCDAATSLDTMTLIFSRSLYFLMVLS